MIVSSATLHHDLRRNDVDSDLMDVGFCIKEAEYALRHLHHWVKAERQPTPLLLEPAHVRVRRDPLGVTLIIGPWNEPLMLTFGVVHVLRSILAEADLIMAVDGYPTRADLTRGSLRQLR